MHTFNDHTPLRRGITLLEASAGTGKTYQITSLVLRLVTEREVAMRNILLVTFTRAATAELRERVRRRLTDAAAAFAQPRRPSTDATVAALLERAAAEGRGARWRLLLEEAVQAFDQVSISTIHGFCQRALAQHAFESGAAFGQTLVDDARPLLEEVVDDYLSAQLNTAGRRRFERWANAKVFKRSDLLALARVAVENPDAPVDPSVRVDGAAKRAAYASLRDTMVTHRAEIIGAYVDARGDGKPLKRATTWVEAKIAARLDQLVQGLAAASEADDDWYEVLADIDLTWFDPTKKYPDFEMPTPLAAVIERMRQLDDDLALARAEFVEYVRTEVQRRHRLAGTQSYTDLVRQLAEALRDPARSDTLARAIGDRFEAALIDEFQDTDTDQWTIFERCFGGGAHYTCLIGDPKQAIYGFRGANVHVYLAARRRAEAGTFTMDRNYRSDGGYVAALNAVFAPTPTAGATVFGDSADRSGITYPEVSWPERDPATRLRWPAQAAAPGGPAPLQLRWCGPEFVPGPDGSSSPKALGKQVLHDALLPRVAEDVVELLHSGAELHDAEHGWRDFGPGDVAVLVRTRQQASDIKDVLEARGVPSVIAGAGNVFESEEAHALALWLAAVASPGSDRAARAAAITPIFGWSGDDLGRLEAEDPATEARWSRWLEALSEARTTFIERGFMAALRRCMERFDVSRRVLELERGARRLTNFLHVAELVHAATTTERLRLVGAIRWLEERSADPTLEAEGAELRLEGDEDAVRIVTVHASKGLQYPVVFVPFAWGDDAKSPGPATAVLVADADDPTRRRLDVHTNPNHPARAEAIGASREANVREGVRLLYVALTRAQMRCVLYDAYADQLKDSALATVLHAGAGALDARTAQPDRVAAAAARVARATAAELREDLEVLADRNGAHIDLTTAAPTDASTRFEVAVAAPTALRVRNFDRAGLDTTWRRSSFTAMVAGHASEIDASLEGLDHDALANDVAVAEAALSLAEPPSLDSRPEVPLAAFPAGAREGTFLHAIFEHAEFDSLAAHTAQPATSKAAFAQLVDREAEVHGMDLRVAASPDRGLNDPWSTVLVDGLIDVLATPLGGPLGDWRLCDLSRGRRLDELRFDLPVAGGHRHRARMGPASGRARHSQAPVADHAFVEALSGPGSALRPAYRRALTGLNFGRLAGYLTGSIDLVFAAPDPEAPGRERWWIADYKSNRLDLRRDGNVTIDNYCPEWMTVEMERHHYFVQLHLYLLALHRYLEHRLDDYDYERDVGGAYYLFVRGMVGPDTPCDDEGRRHGVAFHRPGVEVIDALDRLFGREHERGAAQ